MVKDTIEIKKEVGVLVNGQATFLGPMSEAHVSMPPVYIDEAEFLKVTRMHASAPARVALLRLLHEDVTAKALSRVWRDELDFVGNRFTLRLDRWVPRLTLGLLVALCASSIASAALARANHAVVFLVMLSTLILSVMFFSTLWHQYLPYLIAARIKPLVDLVNAELPELIEAWKRGSVR